MGKTFLGQNVLSSTLVVGDKVEKLKAFITSWLLVKEPEEIKFLDFLNYAYRPELLPLGRRENPFHHEIMVFMKEISEDQGYPDFAKVFKECSNPEWKPRG